MNHAAGINLLHFSLKRFQTSWFINSYGWWGFLVILPLKIIMKGFIFWENRKLSSSKLIKSFILSSKGPNHNLELPGSGMTASFL